MGWTRRSETIEEPQASGLELRAAATAVGSGDPVRDQRVAFDVAIAVREGVPDALAALHVLLERMAGADDVAQGTLINALTAVQYAAVVPEQALGWRPPSAALTQVIRRAQGADAMLREQADDLLEALGDVGVRDAWLAR